MTVERRLLYICAFPSLDKTEGIPHLVAEIAALFAQCLVEQDVVACRCCQEHTHAYTVCSVFVNQTDRVGAVAQLLAHLAALAVAYDTGKVDVAERYVAQIFLTCHNHACHPEEDDIGTGYQICSGVVVLNLLVAWIVDAVEQRYRPQP